MSISEPEIATRVLDNLEPLERLLSVHRPSDMVATEQSRLAELQRLLGFQNVAETETFLHAMPIGQVMNDLAHFFSLVGPKVTDTSRFFHSNFAPVADAIVVDAGCSIGRHLVEASRYSADLIGLDISPLSVCLGSEAWSRTQSRPQPLWCAADILRLPLGDSSVTHALPFVVLGLVPLGSALRELRRILRPNGQLIFTIEGVGFWRRLWDSSPTFGLARVGLARWWLGRQLLRIGFDWRQIRATSRLAGLTQYTPQMLEETLRNAGFALEKLEPLTLYRAEPSLIGVAARKVADSRYD